MKHSQEVNYWRYDVFTQSTWEEWMPGSNPCVFEYVSSLESAKIWSDTQGRWPPICDTCAVLHGLKW